MSRCAAADLQSERPHDAVRIADVKAHPRLVFATAKKAQVHEFFVDS
jgi:hypothetical protein